MKKYLILGIIEADGYIQRILPCEYVSDDPELVLSCAIADEQELVIADVQIDNLKKMSFGKRIYAAFTEEQYKDFSKCRRCVDFAGILESYKDMP